jgi:hypothetical protein
MTNHLLRCALVLAALAVAGCQSFDMGGGQAPPPQAIPTAMDGNWASTDGVFVASFERGGFVSRFTATNEMLAKGTYTVTGTNVSMNWISVATKQQRAAACTFMSADTVACNQQGGGKFELRRGSGVMPMAAAATAPAPAPMAAPTPAPAPMPAPASAPAPQ